MGQDHIRYDILAQDALRGVIRKVLAEIAATARLPGDHHFFITFLTGAPGVRLSQHLKAKYPEQMTIVIQHQFWDLAIHEDHFQVSLNFDHVPEKLVIPFSAVKGFLDPAVQFGLQFEVVPTEADVAPETTARKPAKATRPVTKGKAPAPAPEVPDADVSPDAGGEPSGQPNVVSLDAFRKK
jgi:hypothetical protein